MIKIKNAAALFLLLNCFNAEIYASNAESAFLSGGSAYYTGRAGTGVSDTAGDLSSVNPASMALLERFTLSMNYGSLNGGFSYPYSMLAVPTDYGVIGFGFGYFADEKNPEFKAYTCSAGISKEVSSKILFGISVEAGYLDSTRTDYYAGIKPGLIFRFDGSTSVSGFGFFDPSIGITGCFGYGSDSRFSLNSATVGYSFSFFKSRIYSIGFYNDFSAIEGYKDFPVKFGLETVILNSLSLKCGAVFPDSYEYMKYTAGAGYRYTGDAFTGSVNYALSYSREHGVNHFAGITLGYGALDKDPPVISITPDYTYISPNHDGVQDYLIFDTEVRDKSRISGWKLQISDDNDNIVREFRMSDRRIEDSITLSAFFSRLFSTKESMTVPEKILWDGSDNSGNTLADGKYKYYFYAWDARDNIAPVKSGFIVIDNTSPEVSINADSMIFSPNGDNNKDTLVIRQKIKSSAEDIWTGEIKNSSGVTVASYKWDGGKVPAKFVWEGLDGSGNPLPDGLYYYSISSTDKAGNRAAADIREIILITKMETADIRFENEYFSYHKNDKPSIRFFPDLSSVKGIERWEVTVTVSGEKKPVAVVSGTGIPPAFIDWDCNDNKGKHLDDGVYDVRFSTWYSSGNNPVSFPKRLIIDSTPPKTGISHEPGLFSPDGDGENDYLTLNIKSEDRSGFREWEINIFNESGILFKKFAGRGEVPKQLKWDGRGEEGDLVESASDYDVQFKAVDNAGNISETAVDKIQVDILVVVTERGLKMRISNIEFDFASSNIRRRGIKILDRVYQILEKYSRYNVVVEGHTDDIGDEDYNLKLSEKRAQAVRDYLVDKGTRSGRLKYIGMGESLPFYPNTNDDNRRRNRRVEFLLIKISE